MRTIEKIIIHCSATRPSMDIGVAEIEQWHKKRGFKSIAYHYVIRRNGSIEKGRPEEEEGAHCLGHNKRSIGICYVGGVAENDTTPQDNRTEAQKQTLLRLIVKLKMRYPSAEIVGHNELSRKACPSFDVQQWKKEVELC